MVRQLTNKSPNDNNRSWSNTTRTITLCAVAAVVAFTYSGSVRLTSISEELTRATSLRALEDDDSDSNNAAKQKIAELEQKNQALHQKVKDLEARLDQQKPASEAAAPLIAQNAEEALAEQIEKPVAEAATQQTKEAPASSDIQAIISSTATMSNLHENFPTTCGQVPSNLNPAIEPLVNLYWYNLQPTPGYRRFMYVEGKGTHGLGSGGGMSELEVILRTQVCLYDALSRWNALTKRIGMTRWAVHGGSAMAAGCYGAVSPWDDDIDISVANCGALDQLWEQAPSPLVPYPDINPNHISCNETKNLWIPKLIEDDNLIVIKGHGATSWYKVMTIEQARNPYSKGIMGMDVECMDRAVSSREKQPKAQSGWTNYLKESQPLDEVLYGPTTIQMLPAPIHQKYVELRYRKHSPCRYPFHHGLDPEPFPLVEKGRSSAKHGRDVYVPTIQASAMDEAIAKWYVPKEQRKQWLDKVGDGKQQEYTSQFPNLNHIEVENNFSPGCDWGSANGATIKVIGWNAERGKHWDKFVSLIEELDLLKEPYVVLLNEMDIGMARTGNVHTTRRLAHRLKMNYAYSVEFLELTRGNKQEQNATQDQRDALGLHGNAILTKCILGDTMVLRDPLSRQYFMRQAHWMNGNGFEKRLGGRGGVFARIYQKKPAHLNLRYEYQHRTPSSTQEPHFVVGNVHKVDGESPTNRQALWKYFGFGEAPTDGGRGQDPGNQLGVVIQGDIDPKVCELGGLERMTTPGVKLRTFPVKSCEAGKVHIGHMESDTFCSSMTAKRNVEVTPPCWYKNDQPALTMSDHAIVSVEVQGKILSGR